MVTKKQRPFYRLFSKPASQDRDPLHSPDSPPPLTYEDYVQQRVSSQRQNHNHNNRHTFERKESYQSSPVIENGSRIPVPTPEELPLSQPVLKEIRNDCIELGVQIQENFDANDILFTLCQAKEGNVRHMEEISLLLSYVIDNGADVNRRSLTGYRPLHLVSMAGNIKAIPILLSRGANIHVPCGTKHGMTPLHYAAMKGHVDAVEYLISQGAIIDAKNPLALTPLMLAVIFGQEYVATRLLAAGADSRTRNVHGDTILIAWALQGLKTPKGRAVSMFSLLYRSGVDIQARNHAGKSAANYPEFARLKKEYDQVKRRLL